MKQRAIAQQALVEEPDYQPIEMPRNSPTGFFTAFFASATGFALIWHIWWLVILGLIGAYAAFVLFAWRREDEYVIPAGEVARLDRARRAVRVQALARSVAGAKGNGGAVRLLASERSPPSRPS